MPKPSQAFMRGTLFLSAAALINRILGLISGMFVARVLGAEGIGLLMMAHPLVPLVITITELGLPVAISKLVAEADARGDRTKVRRTLHVSLFVTGFLSVALTTLTLLGSEWIASILLSDQRAYYAMLAITPIAPIVAVSAVLKGYFRGKQRMQTIAASDVLENTVQIACVLALVHVLLPYGVAYAAAGAMAASVVSEISSLMFLLASYKLRGEIKLPGETWAAHLRKGRSTLTELLRIGLPTTGNGLIHSLYHAFQPLLITTSLAAAGISTAAATKQFGMIAGYAFPLLFMPSFITQSLSTALIPAISEAAANKNSLLMHERMELALRLGFLIGAPATVILYVWSTPLTTLIYNAPEAGQLLQILAPMFFLHYFDAPLHAILLGLGRANATLWNYVITTAFKIAAIYVLGSEFGIVGIAVALGLSIVLMTMLNFYSISGSIGFYWDIRPYARGTFSMIIMVLCGQWAIRYLDSLALPMLWNTIGSVCFSLLVYIAVLSFTKAWSQKSKRIYS
ncbi:stage V sporulation protein B [Paenibacillus mucilaginosus]|uniref:Stage V sporulation protein B n=2 Tax=Paenibacillus mucilaginosus TaxID=61624 RepID=I0BFV9_9BACL|nr:stage V sporulation protein B [Paenibacillus mucilaginosus]AEI40429.1 stage V sporulation protein B [Paenibacillus mucilaginosus KNP414]AFH61256.1 stage V sporulation protein B [Paenibacillus mucilaginosus K02]MCG7213226.1 stage V sporulation protein B [Paenibacillus mucilaginosus]WDM29608.1 stage V sporulation protein B [Paenibacillus mucilaginosus]